MKTQNTHRILPNAAVFPLVIRRRIHLKANTSPRTASRPRVFRRLLLCGAAAALWAMPATASAQLGNYPPTPTTVQLSGNTTVAPVSPPVSTTSITVSTSTDFKGLLEGNPATGVVRVTNAHPAGSYTVTVTGFGPGGTTTKTFMLTVTASPCGPGFTDGFTNAANVIPNSSPFCVAIGDFDRDGRQDLAVVSFNSNTVSIRLGNGSGGFTSPTVPEVSVGSKPRLVAIGDFNGDGTQDLAVSNSSSNNVSILLGGPNVTFNGAPAVSVGSDPYSVAIGDFNGDARKDLAVANQNSDTVSIRLGDGLGGFSGTTAVSVGDGPRSVAIGDFDGNGYGTQDLATANYNSNTVSICLGNGSGGFTLPLVPAVGVGPNSFSVAIGNFDGNETQDLAVANVGLNTVSIRAGDGLGGFSGSTEIIGGGSISLAIGDFNRNGKQDLAVANLGSSNVSIYLGNGSGGFNYTAALTVENGPRFVAIGDFNADGKQDLAVANYDSNTVSIRLGACIPLPGSTPTPTPTPPPTPTPCGFFSENFDGVTAPFLPVDWVASNAGIGSGSMWVTSSSGLPAPPASSMPNAAFVDDPPVLSDKYLVSPSFPVPLAPAQVRFRNNYDLESGFDGGVLEISINGSAFMDIITAGGIFVCGGYNATINHALGNPIEGRNVWTGNSGGYICSIVRLPATASGQMIRLRFRMGSDSSVPGAGWRIDRLHVSVIPNRCCGCCCQRARPWLANISTRAPVGGLFTPKNSEAGGPLVPTGSESAIGGFIITGNDSKRVLLRAIGPSLSGFGLPNALADPVLELHGPGTFVTITNNNWRDAQEAEIQATGIPPTNDLESAIAVTLEPGAYTAILRGNNDTSGVALIEAYDLDEDPLSSLANISTRALVGTGENIVIAGFVLSQGEGGGDEMIVVRGIGPSLTALGVPNALADPTLELRNSNGALLLANNDWQENPEQAAELTALGLAPTNQFESGMAAILPPGLYTALLAGRNNGTGVGLVEVYDLGPP